MFNLPCTLLVMLAFVVIPSTAMTMERGEITGPLRLLDDADNEFVISNFSERPATAVLFLSGRCPITERSIDAVHRLYQKYRLSDVLYVGVCANSVETASELKSFAQKRGVVFSIYRDPAGAVAGQLGASMTPEVCLFNNEGRVVYRGGLDRDAGLAALEAAIRQLLQKKPVNVAAVPVKGTPIHEPGNPIKRRNPYGAPSVSSELVFSSIPGAPAHHCSTMVETPNSDLLCLWYGGSYESADDQKLFLARRTIRTRQWSIPIVLLENRHTPPGNAVIFVDGKNRLQIVWCRMESTRPIRRGGGWGKCRLFARSSTDDGHSWSEDRMLFADEGAFYGVLRNPPITLSDGTMVLPLDGPGGGVFLLSANGGETWTRGGTASKGSQPTLAQREDGSLLTFMRSRPRTTRATSLDGGVSWSATESTTLRNPGSGISMVQLSNKNLALAFNDSTVDRTPLSIARSTDEGQTWEEPLHLESNPGEYSYPCIIQSSDGQIHVSYTFRRYSIKHVEFNEDWLTQLKRPN
jgi:predicted neuraminidase